MELRRSPKGNHTSDSAAEAAHCQAPPTYMEIENILRMALTAPSGDNSQPWSFTWNDNTLAIFYVHDLGNHALNNSNHATWLSLGCLLETIAVAATGFKLKASEKLDFENWKTKPVAILNFQRDQSPTDPLISEVYRRRTSRIPFSKAELPASTLEQMHKESEKFSRCQFSFRAGPPTAIYDFLEYCDEFMWKNTKVAHDFLTWTRLSNWELAHRTDGLPWMSLGIKKADLIPLRLFRRFPFLISLVWNFGFRQKVNQTTKALLQSNAGLYCLSISDQEPASILEAGRLAYRLWLLLSEENFAVQPLSLASLTAFDMLSGSPPPQTLTSTIEIFKQGYQRVKDYFGLSASQQPIWMFRTGKLVQPGIAVSSPRVNIHDRLKVSTRDLKSN